MNKTLAIDGALISWDEGGAGVPIVFVHGVIMDRRTWRSQHADVAKDHRFVAVDLRHHGQSDRSGEYSLARHARDLVSLLGQLGMPRAAIVGHSYGANVAVSLLLTAPELVAGGVLIEPSLDGVLPRDVAAAQAVLAARNSAFKAAISALKQQGHIAAMRVLAEWIDNGHVASWEAADPSYVAMLENNAHTFALALGTATETDAIGPHALRSIQSPVLVVNGAQTQPYFAEVGRAVAQSIPHAQYVVIPDASHDVACHNPAAFNAELLRFIDWVDGGGVR